LFGPLLACLLIFPLLWVSTPLHPFFKRPLMRMCTT
jgi:hypothetical protein